MRRLLPLFALLPLAAHAHPGHELLDHTGSLLFIAGLVVGVVAAPMLRRALRQYKGDRD